MTLTILYKFACFLCNAFWRQFDGGKRSVQTFGDLDWNSEKTKTNKIPHLKKIIQTTVPRKMVKIFWGDLNFYEYLISRDLRALKMEKNRFFCSIQNLVQVHIHEAATKKINSVSVLFKTRWLTEFCRECSLFLIVGKSLPLECLSAFLFHFDLHNKSKFPCPESVATKSHNS